MVDPLAKMSVVRVPLRIEVSMGEDCVGGGVVVVPFLVVVVGCCTMVVVELALTMEVVEVVVVVVCTMRVGLVIGVAIVFITWVVVVVDVTGFKVIRVTGAVPMTVMGEAMTAGSDEARTAQSAIVSAVLGTEKRIPRRREQLQRLPSPYHDELSINTENPICSSERDQAPRNGRSRTRREQTQVSFFMKYSKSVVPYLANCRQNTGLIDSPRRTVDGETVHHSCISQAKTSTVPHHRETAWHHRSCSSIRGFVALTELAWNVRLSRIREYCPDME